MSIPPFPGFDVTKPNVARIYNYLLGGKDNYASDRAATEEILEIEPDSVRVAQENRAFLGRAVRYLAGEKGIRQFLDIGSGLPSAGNVHEIAQACAPESRIVYIDNDITVLAHARALMDSSPQGMCSYVQSDLRDTGNIIAQAEGTLDFAKPVAVLFVSILHFVPDQDDPWGIVARFMAAVPPGSYLVVSHATPEGFADPENKKLLDDVYAGTPSGGVTPRPKGQIGRFFTGLEVVDPGIVHVWRWRRSPLQGPVTRTLYYVGVGRKDG